MTIQDWIDALLSGKYSQTKNRLRDSDGFCCLGVACDVKNPLQWNEYTVHPSEKTVYSWTQSDGYNEAHALPTTIQKELEMSDDQLINLADMNDSGKTFIEIAEQIKEYAEENKGAV